MIKKLGYIMKVRAILQVKTDIRRMIQVHSRVKYNFPLLHFSVS